MPQLSIVVPTFNELGNVTELRDRIAAALPGVDWELIYVDDDSPDGTAEQLVALAQQDRRVRCMLRIGRRGLVYGLVGRHGRVYGLVGRHGHRRGRWGHELSDLCRRKFYG